MLRSYGFNYWGHARLEAVPIGRPHLNAPTCREARGRWPAEPFWMESNWPVGTPRLITYLRPSRREDTLAPWLGVLVAGACLAVTAYARRVIRNREPMRDGERGQPTSSL